jgi:hypothetical protein
MHFEKVRYGKLGSLLRGAIQTLQTTPRMSAKCHKRPSICALACFYLTKPEAPLDKRQSPKKSSMALEMGATP